MGSNRNPSPFAQWLGLPESLASNIRQEIEHRMVMDTSLEHSTIDSRSVISYAANNEREVRKMLTSGQSMSLPGSNPLPPKLVDTVMSRFTELNQQEFAFNSNGQLTTPSFNNATRAYDEALQNFPLHPMTQAEANRIQNMTQRSLESDPQNTMPFGLGMMQRSAELYQQYPLASPTSDPYTSSGAYTPPQSDSNFREYFEGVARELKGEDVSLTWQPNVFLGRKNPDGTPVQEGAFLYERGGEKYYLHQTPGRSIGFVNATNLSGTNVVGAQIIEKLTGEGANASSTFQFRSQYQVAEDVLFNRGGHSSVWASLTGERDNQGGLLSGAGTMNVSWGAMGSVNDQRLSTMVNFKPDEKRTFGSRQAFWSALDNFNQQGGGIFKNGSTVDPISGISYGTLYARKSSSDEPHAYSLDSIVGAAGYGRRHGYRVGNRGEIEFGFLNSAGQEIYTSDPSTLGAGHEPIIETAITKGPKRIQQNESSSAAAQLLSGIGVPMPVRQSAAYQGDDTLSGVPLTGQPEPTAGVVMNRMFLSSQESMAEGQIFGRSMIAARDFNKVVPLSDVENMQSGDLYIDEGFNPGGINAQGNYRQIGDTSDFRNLSARLANTSGQGILVQGIERDETAGTARISYQTMTNRMAFKVGSKGEMATVSDTYFDRFTFSDGQTKGSDIDLVSQMPGADQLPAVARDALLAQDDMATPDAVENFFADYAMQAFETDARAMRDTAGEGGNVAFRAFAAQAGISYDEYNQAVLRGDDLSGMRQKIISAAFHEGPNGAATGNIRMQASELFNEAAINNLLSKTQVVGERFVAGRSQLENYMLGQIRGQNPEQWEMYRQRIAELNQNDSNSPAYIQGYDELFSDLYSDYTRNYNQGSVTHYDKYGNREKTETFQNIDGIRGYDSMGNEVTPNNFSQATQFEMQVNRGAIITPVLMRARKEGRRDRMLISPEMQANMESSNPALAAAMRAMNSRGGLMTSAGRLIQALRLNSPTVAASDHGRRLLNRSVDFDSAIETYRESVDEARTKLTDSGQEVSGDRLTREALRIFGRRTNNKMIRVSDGEGESIVLPSGSAIAGTMTIAQGDRTVPGPGREMADLLSIAANPEVPKSDRRGAMASAFDAMSKAAENTEMQKKALSYEMPKLGGMLYGFTSVPENMAIVGLDALKEATGIQDEDQLRSMVEGQGDQHLSISMLRNPESSPIHGWQSLNIGVYEWMQEGTDQEKRIIEGMANPGQEVFINPAVAEVMQGDFDGDQGLFAVNYRKVDGKIRGRNTPVRTVREMQRYLRREGLNIPGSESIKIIENIAESSMGQIRESAQRVFGAVGGKWQTAKGLFEAYRNEEFIAGGRIGQTYNTFNRGTRQFGLEQFQSIYENKLKQAAKKSGNTPLVRASWRAARGVYDYASSIFSSFAYQKPLDRDTGSDPYLIRMQSLLQNLSVSPTDRKDMQMSMAKLGPDGMPIVSPTGDYSESRDTIGYDPGNYLEDLVTTTALTDLTNEVVERPDGFLSPEQESALEEQYETNKKEFYTGLGGAIATQLISPERLIQEHINGGDEAVEALRQSMFDDVVMPLREANRGATGDRVAMSNDVRQRFLSLSAPLNEQGQTPRSMGSYAMVGGTSDYRYGLGLATSKRRKRLLNTIANGTQKERLEARRKLHNISDYHAGLADQAESSTHTNLALRGLGGLAGFLNTVARNHLNPISAMARRLFAGSAATPEVISREMEEKRARLNQKPPMIGPQLPPGGLPASQSSVSSMETQVTQSASPSVNPDDANAALSAATYDDEDYLPEFNPVFEDNPLPPPPLPQIREAPPNLLDPRVLLNPNNDPQYREEIRRVRENLGVPIQGSDLSVFPDTPSRSVEHSTGREETVSQLQSLPGIGVKKSEAIYDTFGDDSMDIVANDPQRLSEVKGVGQATIDRVISSQSDASGIDRAIVPPERPVEGALPDLEISQDTKPSTQPVVKKRLFPIDRKHNRTLRDSLPGIPKASRQDEYPKSVPPPISESEQDEYPKSVPPPISESGQFPKNAPQQLRPTTLPEDIPERPTTLPEGIPERPTMLPERMPDKFADARNHSRVLPLRPTTLPERMPDKFADARNHSRVLPPRPTMLPESTPDKFDFDNARNHSRVLPPRPTMLPEDIPLRPTTLPESMPLSPDESRKLPNPPSIEELENDIRRNGGDPKAVFRGENGSGGSGGSGDGGNVTFGGPMPEPEFRDGEGNGPGDAMAEGFNKVVAAISGIRGGGGGGFDGPTYLNPREEALWAGNISKMIDYALPGVGQTSSEAMREAILSTDTPKQFREEALKTVQQNRRVMGHIIGAVRRGEQRHLNASARRMLRLMTDKTVSEDELRDAGFGDSMVNTILGARDAQGGVLGQLQYINEETEMVEDSLRGSNLQLLDERVAAQTANSRGKISLRQSNKATSAADTIDGLTKSISSLVEEAEKASKITYETAQGLRTFVRGFEDLAASQERVEKKIQVIQADLGEGATRSQALKHLTERERGVLSLMDREITDSDGNKIRLGDYMQGTGEADMEAARQLLSEKEVLPQDRMRTSIVGAYYAGTAAVGSLKMTIGEGLSSMYAGLETDQALGVASGTGAYSGGIARRAYDRRNRSYYRSRAAESVYGGFEDVITALGTEDTYRMFEQAKVTTGIFAGGTMAAQSLTMAGHTGAGAMLGKFAVGGAMLYAGSAIGVEAYNAATGQDFGVIDGGGEILARSGHALASVLSLGTISSFEDIRNEEGLRGDLYRFLSPKPTEAELVQDRYRRRYESTANELGVSTDSVVSGFAYGRVNYGALSNEPINRLMPGMASIENEFGTGITSQLESYSQLTQTITGGYNTLSAFENTVAGINPSSLGLAPYEFSEIGRRVNMTQGGASRLIAAMNVSGGDFGQSTQAVTDFISQNYFVSGDAAFDRSLSRTVNFGAAYTERTGQSLDLYGLQSDLDASMSGRTMATQDLITGAYLNNPLITMSPAEFMVNADAFGADDPFSAQQFATYNQAASARNIDPGLLAGAYGNTAVGLRGGFFNTVDYLMSQGYSGDTASRMIPTTFTRLQSVDQQSMFSKYTEFMGVAPGQSHGDLIASMSGIAQNYETLFGESYGRELSRRGQAVFQLEQLGVTDLDVQSRASAVAELTTDAQVGRQLNMYSMLEQYGLGVSYEDVGFVSSMALDGARTSRFGSILGGMSQMDATGMLSMQQMYNVSETSMGSNAFQSISGMAYQFGLGSQRSIDMAINQYGSITSPDQLQRMQGTSSQLYGMGVNGLASMEFGFGTAGLDNMSYQRTMRALGGDQYMLGMVQAGMVQDSSLSSVLADSAPQSMIDISTGLSIYRPQEMALEDEGHALQIKSQLFGIGMAESQFTMQQAYQFGGTYTDANGQQRAIARGSIGIQEAQFALQGQQADYGFQVQELEMLRGFQRQETAMARSTAQSSQEFDWQISSMRRQENLAQLQFGWSMEDFDENLKFTKGRDRMRTLRQRDRAVISESIRREGASNEENKAKERREWQVEQEELNKKYYEEDKDLKQEQFQKNRDFYKQNRSLQREQMELSKQQARDAAEFRRKELDHQREMFQKNEELYQQQLKLRRAMEEHQGQMNVYVNQTLPSLLNALDSDSVSSFFDAIAAGVQSLSDISMPTSRPTPKPSAPAKSAATARPPSKQFNAANKVQALSEAADTITSSILGSFGFMFGGYADTAMPGFEDGGYTGDGGKNEIAGFVHKGEYVIPSSGAPVVRGDNQQTVLLLTGILEVLKNIAAQGRQSNYITSNTYMREFDGESLLDSVVAMRGF